MVTKCLIVDDEPLAIEIIENYLNQLDNFEIVAKCKNALQAFKVLEEQDVDLLFLDIQMPQLTGIDFIKALKKRPQVIFTTAYIDYAVESYELEVLDYLVKPISFERFFKAINKYVNLADSTITNKKIILSSLSEEKEYIYVKSNKKRYKISFCEVVYIESIKDYIRINMRNQKIMVKTTLTDFETKLPGHLFLKLHRSYIVNINHVTAHTAKDVEIGAIEIPIGISYKQKVLDTLN